MSKIFLITAPSGAGKTTLAQRLSDLGFWTECVSHTTREMREGEQEGKTYYYVDTTKFDKMFKNGEFAERVTYNGNFYGVSKAEIERVLATGKHVFIIVEYYGYIQIKSQFPEAVGIFLYMQKEHCMANMLLRGDSLDNALDRIDLYDDEIRNRGEYDYVIKNVHGKQYETENILKAIVNQYNDYNKLLFNTDPNQLFIKTTPLGVGVIAEKGTTYSDWK